MKKIIIISGIILTSGLAALALSNNKTTITSSNAKIQTDRNVLVTASATQTTANGTPKSNLSNAD